jgi:hypothetical protein
MQQFLKGLKRPRGFSKVSSLSKGELAQLPFVAALNVLEAMPSRAARWRSSATHRVKASCRPFRRTLSIVRVSPTPAAKHAPFRGTALLCLQAIALCAKVVDLQMARCQFPSEHRNRPSNQRSPPG